VETTIVLSVGSDFGGWDYPLRTAAAGAGDVAEVPQPCLPRLPRSFEAQRARRSAYRKPARLRGLR